MCDLDAKPAPPLLASTLLALEETRYRLRLPPASTGLVSLDGLALDGGFRYGEITSIAGASGMGKTLLAFHAIASHLLGHSKSEVAFIDTTGSFSPLRLQSLIAFRLKEQAFRQERQANHTIYVHEEKAKRVETQDETVYLGQATKLLDRVQVMRVFDFAGVVEAMGEVGRICDTKNDQLQQSETYEPGDQLQEEKDEAEQDGIRRVVEDSQDESSDLSDSPTSNESTGLEINKENSEVQATRMSMIVIDSITPVVNAIILKNQTQGQSLLSTTMRSLRHLTTRHNICTLLLNSAVGLSPNQTSYHRKSTSNASIFSSTLGKPALGKSYAYCIDTSVFLSRVPKAREDAEKEYTGGGGGVKVGVLEVLADRYGGREGRWGSFEIGAGGLGIRDPG